MAEQGETQHLFVDEAGDPVLFDGKGRPLLGGNGCSRYFILGKLDVTEPGALAVELTKLRETLKRDPLFASVESFKPERRKTAVLFHAKDDLPDVRVKVFDLLRSFGSGLRFHGVVCDKATVLAEETARRAANPKYRYNPDHLYDRLTRSLFGKFHHLADRYRVCIAKRGTKDRNTGIRQALEHAEADFASAFGFSRGGADAWELEVSNPERTVCLQAVDYFLWALQRFYEPREHTVTKTSLREDRYLNALWPQIAEVHDLHHGPARGTFFNVENRLTIEGRFPDSVRAKKRP